MKIRTGQRTATLAHPQHPELKIRVREMSAPEKSELRDLQRAHLFAEAVMTPGGEVLRKADGTAETITKLRDQEAFSLAAMKKVVADILGLEDEKTGQPIKFVPDVHLYHLFERDFQVEMVEPLPEDAASGATPETRTVTFAEWIMSQIRKPETFDPDPTGASSQQPSIGP